MHTLLAIVLVTAATAPLPLPAQRSPDLAAFDQYVARAARDWHVPGLAIAVVKDDSLVFAKGYGVLELGKPAPVTAHTRFAIGSTTKAMTVAALAMLVDEGKLKWDDRVIDYLPDFRLYDPYVTRELTIRDLLTHRSGLPGTDLLWSFNSYPQAEIIQRLRYVKPAWSFRATWDYQNVMYLVAGTIVARVSGMPWEDFVRTRIFTPLGMTETEPTVAAIVGRPNVAIPHAELNDTVRVVPVHTTDPVAPAGSVWSSVSDMSRWMRFMLDSGRVGTKQLITLANFREIVAPEIRAPLAMYPATTLSRPRLFTYALGWFVQEYHGETVWMHTGSIDGMSAIIGLLPSRHVGVYVLANLDHAELRHALMYKVFDLYSGNPSRDWSAELLTLFGNLEKQSRAAQQERESRHVTGTHPSLPLADYVGTYTDSAYGNVEVTFADGVLRSQFAHGAQKKLDHWEYDTFRAHADTPVDEDFPVTFITDGAGHVASVRMFGVTFTRVRGR